MTGNKKDEAMLYYLYMMADGEVTDNEEKIFKKICKELSVMAEDKKAVIKKCKELVEREKSAFNAIIVEKIDEKASIDSFFKKDDSRLAHIIWNLVNLGYADSVYSDEEKEIVSHLVDKWSVSLECYQEFVDAAETILALTNQKEWVTYTFSDDDIRVKKEKVIDSEIKKILKDVSLSIEEIIM